MLIMLMRLMVMPAEAAQLGGINILKTNAAGEPLSGARFYVAREATESEKEDPDCVKETMIIGQEEKQMIYESFYSGANSRGKRIWQIETDHNGKASMYGLEMGTHYLVEAKAPEGYNRITKPVRISVNKYSHLTEEDGILDDAGVAIDNTVHIINVRYRIPETGNREIRPVIVAGIGVAASALALYLISRRRG